MDFNKSKKPLFALVVTGFGMWVVAGLWHNLILPSLYSETHATHEGIWLMLVSYWVLAGFMVYLYPLLSKGSGAIKDGLRTGVFVGVLWIFPYTLTMAGAHDTSIAYVFKNTLWHVVEQGIGGIIIGLVYGSVG